MGRLDEAANVYREALRLRPDDAGAHNNLGATLEQLGHADQAAAEYRESLQRAPDSSATHSNLGRALLAMGRPDEAAAELREALRLDPTLTTTQYLLGTRIGRARSAGRSGPCVPNRRFGIRYWRERPKSTTTTASFSDDWGGVPTR
jgi:tetratricopeptide (TPR) repeat protein